jgi:hypothetical protein
MILFKFTIFFGVETGESQSRKDESKIQTIGDKRFYSNPE